MGSQAQPLATSTRGRPGRTRQDRAGRRLGWLMLAPALAVLGAILVYPLLFSLRISLFDYRLNALDDVRLVGFAQYLSLPGNASYTVALRNTAVFVAVAVTLELVLGLALALAVRRQRRFGDLTRSVLLTPMFVTPIAVGLMFRFLLNEQLGLIPVALERVGVSIPFFGPDLALYSLALVDVWQWTPFMFLLLLAGLESLPVQPFEAARVDGASPWFTFRRVTLPLLRPVIAVAVIIRGLDALRVFEYVFAITRGGPGTTTETIQYQIWRVGFGFFRLGEAAAMAYTVVALVAIAVVALVRFSRRSQEAAG